MEENLKYCPNCGKETLQWEQEKKWFCTSCKFTLYHNVAGAVAILIQHGNEILFTKRNQEPQKGKLDLPGGFVDPKEAAEKTCQREIWEELNWEIDQKNLKYLGSLPNTYLYKNILYKTIDLFYGYEVFEKPEFNLEKNEIASTRWIQINELNIEDLAFDSQKKFFGEMKLANKK